MIVKCNFKCNAISCQFDFLSTSSSCLSFLYACSISLRYSTILRFGQVNAVTCDLEKESSFVV